LTPVIETDVQTMPYVELQSYYRIVHNRLM